MMATAERGPGGTVAIRSNSGGMPAMRQNPASDRLLWFLPDGSYNEVRSLDVFVRRLGPSSLRPVVGGLALAAQDELGWIAAFHQPIGRLTVELVPARAARGALVRLCDYLDECRLVVS